MATTPSNNFDFQNYYSATLQSDITASSLSLALDTVPTPVEGILVIEPDSTTNREIIFYTGKTSSTITLPVDGRGWDGTTATTHLAGSPIIMAPVAYMLRMLKSGSLYDSTKTGWTNLGTAPTYSANNGNGEYVFSTATDLTGTVSKGMKLKFDRPAGTPTQSMAFAAASSQYATKASPTGLTFTSAFTCEAWVYLNSYTSGNQGIISRTDGTNGFVLFVNASDGRLGLAASLNPTFNQISYQSLPLKQWVHVAGTFSAGAMFLYVNGVQVPAVQTGSGSAVTQAGSLQVSAYNSSAFLDGYISEARLWSVAQTTANIRANMGISCTGSETNLVFLAQGNGNFNDKTSNGNSLTATNGAIATQSANPYNPTEYGIVTNLTSSTLTLFMGTDYKAPSTGTLANFYYSSSRAPFGFPTDRAKWKVGVLFKIQTSISLSNAAGNPAGGQLSLPAGAWKLSKRGMEQITAAAQNFLSTNGGLSTAQNSYSADLQQTVGIISSGNVTAGEVDAYTNTSQDYTVTTQTLIYLVFKTGVTSATCYYNGVSPMPYTIEAECTYI